ncbi:hypothetical protein ABZV29_20375 [Streptomyces sp. NPDC005236]|uniref:hypothetical protein n=1 Tax=Streptomyces sp. NPDC005236 TaxID=3157028 RepID=UPI00339DDA56
MATQTVALSESFWLGLGGLIATILGGLLGGYLTYRTQKSVAAATAKSQLEVTREELQSQLEVKREELQSQLAIKREEAQSQIQLKQEEERAAERSQKRIEKANAIVAFVDASDAYWQRINDLWDKVKREPDNVKSFREETAEAAKGLTRAEIRLELVSGGSLREAVSKYANGLVDFAKAAHQDKQWKPPNNMMRDNVIARGREELGYTPLL